MSPTSILCMNCGSSSIKFKLFEYPSLNTIISGSASNVEQEGLKTVIKFTVAETGEKRSEEEDENMDYNHVFSRILDYISFHISLEQIKLVAHRVVHGGPETEPMVVHKGDEAALERMDAYSEFAPLHNHRSILAIRSTLNYLPTIPQLLCFDTLFHQTLSEHIYTYPLSPPPHGNLIIPLRKYGAHGLSYGFVLTSIAEHLRKKAEECSFVVCHLGSGSSVCAIVKGKSYDTSMGVSPLEGLPGGTRTGSVDPVLIFHHTANCGERIIHKGVSLTRAESILNSQGGLQAVAGTSDFGKIVSTVSSDPTSKLAYDLYLDRLQNYIGSYLFKSLALLSPNPLASFDGIVFSGGIGERASRLREDVGHSLRWMGVKIDHDRNENPIKDAVISQVSTDDSAIKLWICQTDEELQCVRLAKDAIEKGRLEI